MKNLNRILVVLAGAGVLAACQDGRRDAPVTGPSFAISEARFGGNRDFFFGSPLAETPQPGDPYFDVGGSNGLLRPYVRVCETDGVICLPTTPPPDVTRRVTGSATGLAMTYNSTAELYQVNWQTKLLDPAKDYRIEVWGVAFSTAAEKAALDPRWLFGWRDIRNSPSVASCHVTDAFCLVNYGKTIPVKVRIEQFVWCPVDRNCAVQFVAAGVNANLEAQSTGGPSAQLFIPGQTGTDFALAFEPCTEGENTAVDAAIDIPTFGTCFKTVAPVSPTLGQKATLSLCDSFFPSDFDSELADASSQRRLIALHHFSTDLSQVKALPEAHNCLNPVTSGAIAGAAPSKGLLRLAFAVRDKVLALVTPRPLMAAARRIDEGGGGATSEIGSFFKLALPARFAYEFADDASQRGNAGSTFTLRVKVVDVFGGPVLNARVNWEAVPPPTGGATVQGIVLAPGSGLTDLLGIVQNTVTLSSSRGFNVFHAFGRGIAGTGCTIPSSTSGSCDGPRTTGQLYGPYDPFQPIHVVHDGLGIDPSGTEAIVDLAKGTFLPFTIFGRGPR